jgi:cysteine desulfurase
MQLFSRRVYADAAAATPLSKSAKRELLRLLSIYGNPGGLHTEALTAMREVEAARERVADTLHAHADEIVFTSGGTEANNMALGGAVSALLGRGVTPHVLTLAIEHPSVLEPLRALAGENLISLTELPVMQDGRLDLKVFKEAITRETALISIQLINSEIGTIQDIREVMKIVRRERTLTARALRAARPSPTLASQDSFPLYVHTDASQAPLWLSLNIEKLGVDLMTLDGQKMLGPKGVGALFVRRGTKLQPVVFGGGQERGLRSGTENVPLIGSFAVALEEAQQGVDKRVARVSEIRDYLLQQIKKTFPQAKIYGTEGAARAANNCSISIPGLLGDMAVLGLDAEGVAASTRSACSTDEEAPSHVVRALGVPAKEAREAIRITLLPTATKRDADKIVSALKNVVHLQSRVIE